MFFAQHLEIAGEHYIPFTSNQAVALRLNSKKF